MADLDLALVSDLADTARDSGWRNIASLLTGNTYVAASAASRYLRIRRIGAVVSLEGRLDVLTSSTAAQILFSHTTLAGFRSTESFPAIIAVPCYDGWDFKRNVAARASVGQAAYQAAGFVAGEVMSLALSWATSEPWPTTLPGVPV